MSFSTAVPQFESIRKWLVKNHKKYVENDQPSNKMLSQFLCQFIQFQEEYLGRFAAPRPNIPVTRLPYEVLVDFQPGGALCHLFSAVFKQKYEQKIAKLELPLFGKPAQLVELCALIEQSLVDNQRIMYPSCYFRQDLFVGSENQSLLNRLNEIVKRHNGQVVDKIEDADHIIYPAIQDLIEPADRKDWVRVLKKRGKESVLVHRIFTPDSQDQWLTNLEIDEDVAGLNDSTNNTSGGDIWELAANWLLDTDLFNEWSNQEDYEVDVESTISEGKVRLKKANQIAQNPRRNG